MTAEVTVTKDTGGVAAAEPVKWTILVYQASDNNLSEESVYALKEIKKKGTTDGTTAGGGARFKVNVFALIDPVGRGSMPRHIRIRGAGGKLQDDTLSEGPFKLDDEIDTGNPQTLINFLTLGIQQFPADHYMVILSGHGGGVSEGFLLRDEERPLSQIPSSLPIGELRGVFDNTKIKEALAGKKINILGFDACMMSMVEVCYELRDLDTLEFVVGAEGFSLNAGWPLDEIVEVIKNDRNIEPLQLAKRIVKEYADFYHDYFIGGLSSDQAVVRLGLIDELRKRIDTLAGALIEKFRQEHEEHKLLPDARMTYDERGRVFQDAIILAHWAAQAYNGEQCVDLADFCGLLVQRLEVLLKQGANVSAIIQACESVINLISPPGAGKVVEANCYTGAAFQYSNGISIYFPWSAINTSPTYKELAFGKNSRWPEFLAEYAKATKRRSRFKGFLDEERHRSTPPYGKGPEGTVLSMRNPPTYYNPEHECTTPDSEPGKREAGD
jgi:hypothetical protein